MKKPLDRIKCKAIVVNGPEKGKEVIGHYSRSHDSSIHYITELKYHLIPFDPKHHGQPRKGTRSHHVDGDTVRQWTGQCDRYNREIYERDVLRFYYGDQWFEGIVKWDYATSSFIVVLEDEDNDGDFILQFGTDIDPHIGCRKPPF